MEFLPYAPKNVTTPILATYTGCKLAVEVSFSHSVRNTLILMLSERMRCVYPQIVSSCALGLYTHHSPIPRGGPLERGLRRVIQDIRIGSLLIQSEDNTGEPLLLHLMLPTCIRQRHLAERSFVFLLDAQIGTGAAAFMAIRVLLDHGVREENIIFVTFVVAASGGMRVLQHAFPRVRVVCGVVDPVLRESWALWDTTPVPSQQSGSGGVSGADELTGPAEAEGRRVWVVEPGMGHIGESSMSLTLGKDILILPHRGSILFVTVAYIPMASRLAQSTFVYST